MLATVKSWDGDSNIQLLRRHSAVGKLARNPGFPWRPTTAQRTQVGIQGTASIEKLDFYHTRSIDMIILKTRRRHFACMVPLIPREHHIRARSAKMLTQRLPSRLYVVAVNTGEHRLRLLQVCKTSEALFLAEESDRCRHFDPCQSFILAGISRTSFPF